jgi:hypothetical protein
MTLDVQTDHATEIERLRLDRDEWRNAAMRADVVIQRFALERARRFGAQASLRLKLDEVLTEARSGGATETVVSGLAELLGLAKEIDVRNCPIDELAKRRGGRAQGSIAEAIREDSEALECASVRSA